MMVLLKTLVFTVVVPGTWIVFIPYWLLSSGSARSDLDMGPFRYFGVIPMILGAAIYFRCAWDFTFTGKGTPAPFDPPKELVARGLYRFVRNPMYIGVLFVLLGGALLFESHRLFELAGLAFVIFYLVIVIYEEPILRRKFGDSYQQYCDSVSRWVPRKPRRQ